MTSWARRDTGSNGASSPAANGRIWVKPAPASQPFTTARLSRGTPMSTGSSRSTAILFPPPHSRQRLNSARHPPSPVWLPHPFQGFRSSLHGIRPSMPVRWNFKLSTPLTGKISPYRNQSRCRPLRGLTSARGCIRDATTDTRSSQQTGSARRRLPSARGPCLSQPSPRI